VVNRQVAGSQPARFIYLHGFASSPASAKAQYFQQQFEAQPQILQIPDLNQDDFFHLTLSRQIQQVKTLLAVDASPQSAPKSVILIGSSFGGLTAAWLGEQCLQVERLVLLAPAFQFLTHWQPRLGRAQIQQWQTTGSLLTYHYGAKTQLPLAYEFMTDLAQYDEVTLQRPLPTLILHGRQDDVIPIQASRDFAASRPWVRLTELESDHALVDVQTQIWQAIQLFCGLIED
jgi:uncharacterized protein